MTSATAPSSGPGACRWCASSKMRRRDRTGMPGRKRSAFMRVWLGTALLVGLEAACRPVQPPASPLPTGTVAGRTPLAAVYYVSPAGSDADPGEMLAHPWRTLQKAADTLTAGETVWIRAGTYHERLWPSNSVQAGLGDHICRVSRRDCHDRRGRPDFAGRPGGPGRGQRSELHPYYRPARNQRWALPR